MSTDLIKYFNVTNYEDLTSLQEFLGAYSFNKQEIQEIFNKFYLCGKSDEFIEHIKYMFQNYELQLIFGERYTGAVAYKCQENNPETARFIYNHLKDTNFDLHQLHHEDIIRWLVHYCQHNYLDFFYDEFNELDIDVDYIKALKREFFENKQYSNELFATVRKVCEILITEIQKLPKPGIVIFTDYQRARMQLIIFLDEFIKVDYIEIVEYLITYALPHVFITEEIEDEIQKIFSKSQSRSFKHMYENSQYSLQFLKSRYNASFKQQRIHIYVPLNLEITIPQKLPFGWLIQINETNNDCQHIVIETCTDWYEPNFNVLNAIYNENTKIYNQFTFNIENDI